MSRLYEYLEDKILFYFKGTFFNKNSNKEHKVEIEGETLEEFEKNLIDVIDKIDDVELENEKREKTVRAVMDHIKKHGLKNKKAMADKILDMRIRAVSNGRVELKNVKFN